MKIVVNRNYGCYSLSEEAYRALGLSWDGLGFLGSEYCRGYAFNNDRTNHKLVEVVESLGERASGWYAHLEVVEIPDDVEWELIDDEGNEFVREKHRVW